MKRKYSILIPTRNRGNTIGPTIRTCLNQDVPDLEIIICDNASDDNTAAVVEELKDPRVRYYYFNELVSMSMNWERGLSYVTGSHLILVGSDDALIPYSLGTLGEMFEGTGTEAINWPRPNYNWPDIQLAGHANNLHIPAIRNRVLMIPQDTEKNLKGVLRELTGYSVLPTLYNSAVSAELVFRIREQSRSGRFFNCQIPDVYSGILIAAHTKEYFTSVIPFSINGGSGNSNGVATFGIRNNNAVLSEFITLNKASNLAYNPLIPDIYCDSTVIGEANLKAREEFPDQIAEHEFSMEQLYHHVHQWIERYYTDSEKPEAMKKLHKAMTLYAGTTGGKPRLIPVDQTAAPNSDSIRGFRKFAHKIAKKLKAIFRSQSMFFDMSITLGPSFKDINQVAVALSKGYKFFYQILRSIHNAAPYKISPVRFMLLAIKLRRIFKKELTT